MGGSQKFYSILSWNIPARKPFLVANGREKSKIIKKLHLIFNFKKFENNYYCSTLTQLFIKKAVFVAFIIILSLRVGSCDTESAYRSQPPILQTF